MQAKISDHKEKNLNSLPEFKQVNLKGLDRSDREIDQLKDPLRTLKGRESYLQAQLAAIPPKSANQDRNMLKELKARLV